MITFEKFAGINNVVPSHRLKQTELTVATNVDVGLTGEVSRRAGYSVASATNHKNLWQGEGFMLATVNDNNLQAFTVGGTYTTVSAALGPDRVWYCNLPDGRTTFSNGLINGITDGTTTTGWGVPVPDSLGALTDVAGQLFPGDYQYQLTYVRLSDGLEGGPLFSNPLPVALGGIVLMGLPALDGYKINVYITAANGDDGFLAGSTTNGIFSYTGKNDALILPCRTAYLQGAPVGTVTAFWRGRVLLASGSVLYASRPHQWELFDLRRDFKQFGAPITLIQPVDGGIFVGTTEELCFLAGDQFDKLTYTRKVEGRTVLGSGVPVRGELVQQREGAGMGSAMVCIADGVITAGFSDGQIVRLSEGRYRTSVTEVAATFRMVGRTPQYLAVPQ